MKNGSTLYNIREMPMKTSTRHHSAPIKLAKIQNTGDDPRCQHRGSQPLLMGAPNGAATLGGSLAIFHKTKHILTIRSSRHAPRYSSRRAENLGARKTLFVAARSNSACSCRHVEADTMPPSRRAGKGAAAHPGSGLSLLSAKEKRAVEP